MASGPERQSAFITAPVAGQVTVLATSAAAAAIDLSTCGPTVQSMANVQVLPQGGQPSVAGCLNRFTEFFADGADVGVVFGAGATNAAVVGANAPALGQQGTDTAGCCIRIPAGTYRTYIITTATRWLGYVGSANGNLRIAVSSLPE